MSPIKYFSSMLSGSHFEKNDIVWKAHTGNYIAAVTNNLAFNYVMGLNPIAPGLSKKYVSLKLTDWRTSVGSYVSKCGPVGIAC